MRSDILRLAADLAARGEPFVMATVVRREPPSSAQVGDRALVTAAGAFHGWLGGSCTRPSVEREARAVLAAGAPRLVSISPDPAAAARPGLVTLPMTCHSGGTVEIYLEPILPPHRLVVVGDSPIARALRALGAAMGYDVRAEPEPGASVVVATMGERDEEALAAAQAARPSYLGLVASRRRCGELRARGVPLDGVRNPAGLDLGAKLPEEVALSILAEIVKLRRAAVVAPAPRLEAVDPVCGMTVAVETARHRAEHDGRTVFFCNARCRTTFLAAPERFAA